MRFKPIDPILEWRRDYPFEDGRHGIYDQNVCHFGSSTKNVTSTTTSAPWSTQVPYLTAGFDTAKGLLGQPAPTQQYPVAPFNDYQSMALSGIADKAKAGSPVAQSANDFSNKLENGFFLNNNPANGFFSSLASSNLGLNNPGATALTGFTNGNGVGSQTLKDYADGKYVTGNNSDPVAQSVMAQVVPQITKQFNAGNSVNNPSMAYAASQGATAALAPLQYQNFQTQEQLQQNAASTLGSQALTGANSLEQGALGGGNLQATGASGLGSNYNTGVTQMVQGNALAPQTLGMNYADMEQLFGAGTSAQQQLQNEMTGKAQEFNYSQLSPYQQLQAYMQAVGGNYGGTGSQTTPYFTNNGANLLSGLAGGAGLLGTVGNAIGGGAAAGSTAAGLASLFAFL